MEALRLLAPFGRSAVGAQLSGAAGRQSQASRLRINPALILPDS